MRTLVSVGARSAPTARTEQGYVEHTCLTCGESYRSDYTEALGHSYVETESVKPTCTESGYITYTCENCGDEYTVTVIAYGHSYEVTEVTDPTCTEQGYTTYTCTECGNSYVSDYTEATGHTYSAVVTAATCVSYGYTTYTCDDCGVSYISDYVAPTGHDYEVYYKINPTEDDYGYTVYRCKTCGDTYLADFQDPGTHVHSYITEVTEPTCTEGGYTTYTCEDCDYSYIDDYTAANGHSYNAVVTEPTCTEGGYTTYTCTECGETYIGDYTEALGHTYSLKEVSIDRTNKIVTVNYACAVCGENGAELLTFLFTDTNGDIHTIYINGNTADYSSLDDGYYTVSLVDGDGNVLSAFSIGEAESDVHTHDYNLNVQTDVDNRILIYSYVCDEGDSDLTSSLTVAFISESGAVNYYDSAYGFIDFNALDIGVYTVEIITAGNEILTSFNLTISEDSSAIEHEHSYFLYVDIKSSTNAIYVNYSCTEDGYNATQLLTAVFTDSEDKEYTFTPDSNGLIDYSALGAGDYTVEIADGENNTLKTMYITITESANKTETVVSYNLSIKIDETSNYIIANYAASDGTDYTSQIKVVLTSESGSVKTFVPDDSGMIDYSGLSNGDYTMQIVDTESGVVIYEQTLTVSGSVSEHSHQYKLTVNQDITNQVLTLAYGCVDGDDDQTFEIAVVFTETTSLKSVTLYADSNNQIDYSVLADGNYIVYVMDGDNLIIYKFTELVTIANTAVETPDTGSSDNTDSTDNTDNTDITDNTDNNGNTGDTSNEVTDNVTTDESNSNTGLIIGLCVTLVVIAAVAVVVVIVVKKKKN